MSRYMLMLLRTYTPLPPLSMFVDMIWYLDGYNPSHSRERSLPDGTADMIINLDEAPIRLFDRHDREIVSRQSILCGPHSDFFVIDSSGRAKVIGVHFKPGGLRPFVKEPLREFLNRHIPLDLIWGSKAGELYEELLGTDVPEAMFRILEKWLLSSVHGSMEYDQAVQYALDQLQCKPVAEVIEQTGFSHRRFNQIFKEEMGMTPKRLQRIYRFQEALNLMNDDGAWTWTDVAFACGYYDQAHFIKDFQSFSGINPGDYRAIPGRHHNHVSLRT
ncbi:helix-turn-helix domain-containing protein [Paenibacillus piri]|uniref:AraC family transcriptional regulator n=1 Tax=Paenibacillus piri TaxID=2547395 RepID=A0A4R5KJZ3_9BACL|nr:helix-turn-helix domain-containing protein [Paenibacillus piri]TDF94797.1 AraC family transcriptional regulator [Paenibacillus piri]